MRPQQPLLGLRDRKPDDRLNYAELLALCGRDDEAIVQLNLARLHDPLSPSVHLARAILLGYQRKFDEARKAWALSRAAGESSMWYLTGAGATELAAGNLDAAEKLLDEAMRRYPDLPAVMVWRACAHARRGERRDAKSLVEACERRFPYYSPASRALVAALGGERQRALDVIRTAIDARDIGLLPCVIHPAFDGFAGLPAWRRLRRRCAVWEAWAARRSGGRAQALRP